MAARSGLVQPAAQAYALDRHDCRILDLLQRNARMSNTDIGKHIGLSQPAVTAHIRTMPAVVGADRITGEDCFMARVTVAAMSELEGAIDQLASLGGVTTSIILASYPPKALPLAAEG